MILGKTFEESFGDKRLDDRGNDIVRSLFIKGSHSIRQFSRSNAHQKGNYRFLENEQTTEEAIVKGISNRCASAVKGKMVLAIQDTSEINLYNHKNRIKQDGSIGVTNAATNGLGFMIHPSLVVDAVNGFPYGYGHIHLFNRKVEREPEELRDKHQYKRLTIAEKESNKWLLSCQAIKENLQEAATIVIVQDREGDIYEQFACVPDERTHLLIRSKSDRTLPEGGKLFAKVSLCDIAGTYSIDIEGDKRKGQKKRTAKMEVRFTEVEIKNSSRTAKGIAPTVKLHCIEARETATSAQHKGVCWRLLTTLPVTTLKEALMIIEWYSWRWMIEEVFRILKKEGFDVEASELAKGTSVKKLCLLTLDAIIKIFQMRIAYEEDEKGEMPASMCFEEAELECIEEQSKKLEGKTEKQKNPGRASSLRFATWVIARLGGWKGYASERKPGITTLWIGLKRLYDIYNGFKIAKDVYTR
jgi:hypothetical protein